MIASKDPLTVRYRPNLGLISVSVDPGNGKGEQTILTLSPAEAVALGRVLVNKGTEYGGNKS